MASIQRLGGGATGVGAPVAARQFLDQPGQSRFMQPSVLAGVGSGVAAGAFYLTDLVDLPFLKDDFLASHAITSTPIGLFYAAFPKRAGQTTTQQVKETLLGGSSSPTRSSGSGTSGTSGSTEVAVQSSGSGRTRRGSGSGY